MNLIEKFGEVNYRYLGNISSALLGAFQHETKEITFQKVQEAYDKAERLEQMMIEKLFRLAIEPSSENRCREATFFEICHLLRQYRKEKPS